MSVIGVECPRCGAGLPPREPDGRFECRYCGASFEPREVRRAHDATGHALSTEQLAEAIVEAQRRLDGRTRRRARPARAAPSSARWVLAGAAAAVAAVGGLVGYLRVAVAPQASIAAVTQAAVAAVGTGPFEQRLMWDDNGGPPIPVAIDGAPAVIGRTRAADGSDLLYVDAYALDGTRRWRVDGLGTYADAYRHVRFAVGGDRLVVSDADASLRLVDLATGKTVRQVPLTDQVDRLCTPLLPVDGEDTRGVREVWLAQVDEATYLVDPATGDLRPAPRPRWCPEDDWPSDRAHDATHPASAAPRLEGLRVVRAYRAGDLGVAAAVKQPGTAIPYAVGFDPSTREVRWKEVVTNVSPNRTRAGEFAALAGDRYVAVYGEGQTGWHLTARDARRGTLLWDVTLSPLQGIDDVDRMEATAEHVFLVRSQGLEVYAAVDGALVMAVGLRRLE